MTRHETTTSTPPGDAGTRRGPLRRVADWLLIAGFIAALALPLGATFLRLDADGGAFENRRKMDFPRLKMTPRGLAHFLGPARYWFKENFGLRGLMVSSHGWIKLHVLGVSASERVAIGQEGWYFYSINGAIDSYRALTPLTNEEVRSWAEVLDARQNWLAKQNCRYLVFFAPNKSTIYPEHLPNWANRIGTESRLDQLQAHLNSRSGMKLLDVRETLSKHKPDAELYHRTDTHWNQLGAFYATQRVGQQLHEWFPAVTPVQLEDYRIGTDDRFSGDLMGMLGLYNVEFESAPRFIPLQGKWVTMADADKGRLVVENTDPAAANLPTAVVLCDSFGMRTVPFLNHYFRRVSYLWTDQFYPPLIEKEKPDVVIQEMVERRLIGYTPWNPAGME